MLAAGEGRRFGATKQLAALHGRPLVAHAVAAALGSGAARTVVVTGHDHPAVRAAVLAQAGAQPGGRTRLDVVHNRAWAEGQSTSVHAGFRTLAEADDGIDVAVVVLGDVPGTDAEVVATVAAAAARSGTGARARYADGPGHPVGFARDVWTRMSDLDGDRGARQLHDLALDEVAVDGPRPRDVDVPADLDRVERGRR